MALGQMATLSGVLLVLGLSLMGLDSPLAFTLPMMLVGVVPALAGSAAALAGLVQQLMGAYSVGLVPHHGSRNLGGLMRGFTRCALGANIAPRRQQVQVLAPQ